jgi:peptide/nickel transport system permease protein
VSDSSSTIAVVGKLSSGPAGFLKRLAKEKPLGFAGGIITLILLFVGIFAHFIAPYGMNECWVGGFLEPPSAKFLMGTDNLGRDVLSRIIYGAQISVIVGLSGTAIATFLSLIIGMVSGYIGGRVDLTVQRGVDIWMCLPDLIVLILLVTAMGPSLGSIIIALGFSWGVPGSRIIRGAVIAIKDNPYVHAAEAIGCSVSRTLLRHILPNVLPTVIVLFSVRVPGIILAEASLSFLGFGIKPPFPSWGGMLSGSGRDYMMMQPLMAVWPGLALAITVFAVNMFGDAVRDIVDPRLRGGVGRFGLRIKKKAVA